MMTDGSVFRKNARAFSEGHVLGRVLSSSDRSGALPAPELVPARSGGLTMKAGHVSLHSLYDPVREGEMWVDEAIGQDESDCRGYVVMGLGLGYHVWSLLERTALPVTVVETDPRRIMLSWDQFEWFRHKDRLRFLCDPVDGKGLAPGFKIVAHAPSEKMDRAGYERFRKLASESTPVHRMSLKILVVPPVYGGSFPVALGVYRSLLRLGHRAEFLDLSPFEGALRSIGAQTSVDLHKIQLRGMFQGFMDELVLARVIHEKPDLILALAQAPMSQSLLAKLKGQGVPVGYWFVEDFRLATYWEHIAPLVTDFAVIQGDSFLSVLADRKIAHATYLPLAADPEVFRPLSLDESDRKRFGANVSFMGAGYYNRHHFLKHLVDFDLAIFGTEWNPQDRLFRTVREGGFRLTPEETAMVFNATKVNINLHSSVYHRGVNPDGDFVNPRTFEIASCGAFQVVDRRRLLPDLFSVGEELAVYENESECRRLISHYLDRESERLDMASKARERVLREHTYDIRMEAWLSVLAGRGVRASQPSLSGRWPVSDLVEEAGHDVGLVRFLENYRGQGAVNLDDLVRPIVAGRGEISKEAATFLLLKEFSGGNG